MLVKPNDIPNDSVRIEHLGGFLYMLWQILYCDYYINSNNREPLFRNACLESLLLHTRVIDEFFWKPKLLEYKAEKELKKPEEKRSIIKYEDDDFLAIHCLTEDEYNELYDKLNSNNYILEQPERELINKKMLHPVYDEKAERIKWNKYSFRCRMFFAFKLFLTYKKPRTLIEKNDRWNNPLYEDVVNLLK